MASKRRLRRKACTNKKAYATHQEGVTASVILHKTTGTHSLNVYKCQFSGHYHVGHQPASVRYAIRSAHA